MLSLSRAEGEVIWVGNVKIQIVRIGREVRVGIDAPEDVPITREELLPAGDPRRALYPSNRARAHA